MRNDSYIYEKALSKLLRKQTNKLLWANPGIYSAKRTRTDVTKNFIIELSLGVLAFGLFVYFLILYYQNTVLTNYLNNLPN